MKILLLGATGLVGKNVLAQALANPAVTGVIAPTRRPLEPRPKLINPISDHLESLLSESIDHGIDGIVCALGTTIKKAGSKDAFREVGLRTAVEVRAICASAWSGDICSCLSECCLRQLCDVLSQNQRRSRADIELVGFRSLNRRSTQPCRRRTRRAAPDGRDRSAIPGHSCSNSSEEASDQSIFHDCRGMSNCRHDSHARYSFSSC